MAFLVADFRMTYPVRRRERTMSLNRSCISNVTHRRPSLGQLSDRLIVSAVGFGSEFERESEGVLGSSGEDRKADTPVKLSGTS